MEKLIDFTSKQWNEYAIIIRYKRSLFRLLVEDLPEYKQKQLKEHDSCEYNITGSAFLKAGKILPESVILNFNNYGISLHQDKIGHINYYLFDYVGLNPFRAFSLSNRGVTV